MLQRTLIFQYLCTGTYTYINIEILVLLLKKIMFSIFCSKLIQIPLNCLNFDMKMKEITYFLIEIMEVQTQNAIFLIFLTTNS
jgi:hypothetical protein